MVKTLITFLLPFIATLNASVIDSPLPSAIPTVDGLLELFRTPLTQKVSELSENFIASTTSSEIIWRSHTSINCHGTTIEKGLPISKISKVNYRNSENELTEEISYVDCTGMTNLKEVVITRGDNLEPASMNEIIKGERSLKLKANETFRDYRIINTFGDQLAEIKIEQKNGQTSTIFSITDKPFLDIVQITKINEVQNHFRFYPIKIAYRYKGLESTINRSITPWSIIVIAQNDKNELPHYKYYNSQKKEVSLASFLSSLNYGAIANPHVRSPTIILKDFMTYHLKRFPETQIVASVGQNDRILNELRLAQIRLINGTELNLVKDLITEYLSSLESGMLKIIDNRPEQ